MDSITRNVVDLAQDDRRALEHILGRPLEGQQSVVIQVVPPPVDVRAQKAPSVQPIDDESLPELPEWLNIYEGLSEEEIEQLHNVINQRSRMSRNIDLD
jgi:hypothetical protein